MRCITILCFVQAAANPGLVGAWITNIGTRASQNNNKLCTRENRINNSNKRPRKKNIVATALKSSSNEYDSAMSAYDRAIRAVSAPSAPPTSSATETGVKEATPSPYFSPFAPPATEERVKEEPTVYNEASAAFATSTSDDGGMSAYDQYMRQQQKNAPSPKISDFSPSVFPKSVPPPPGADFVASTFNDPTTTTTTMSAQAQKMELEQVNAWTNNSNWDDAGMSAYDQFMQQAQNSAATASMTSEQQQQQQKAPPDTTMQGWEPPLTFEESTDPASLLPQEGPQEVFSRPEIPQPSALPPPPPPPPQQQQQQPGPLIPPPTTVNTEDPIARMAAAAASDAPASSLGNDSFMSTAWEDEQPGFLENPIGFLQNIFTPPTAKPKTPKVVDFGVVKPGVSKRIFDSLNSDPNPRAWSQWDAFQNAEDRWYDLKNSKPFRYDAKLFKPFQNEAGPPLQFVSDDCAMGNAKACSKLRDICEKSNSEECNNFDYVGPPLDENGQPVMEYDVVVLGGTLGVFYAMALQRYRLNVCVVAPRELRGQEQEWNVNMEDLIELQRLGILTPDDIEAAITTVYGGSRAGFKNKEVTPLSGGPFDNQGVGFECYLNDVLNLGISPAVLIERVVERFKAGGGSVRERCPLKGVAVSNQVGCAIDLGSYNINEDVEPITSKIVLDCLGYGSPVARQQRYGLKPDSICMVFGSCAGGYNPDRNRFADIMYTFNPLQNCGDKGIHQYFWEAFPVGTNLTAPIANERPAYNAFGGQPTKAPKRVGPQIKSDEKTTYMFTYIDADAKRPSLEEMMDDYWKYLPTYQPSISNPEKQLDIKRVVYDYFPAYRDSPMKPQYSRVLSIGESAGTQSPISFGGFRSLSRNIGRISGAVAEAIEMGCLHKDDLGYIHEYNPQIGVGWFLRDIMSVSIHKKVNPQFTNRVLSVYLKAMYDSGPETIQPFMQDVLKFDALVGTMVTGIVADPGLTVDMVKHVGLRRTLEFLGHIANMGLYGLLDASVSPIMEKRIEKMNNPRERFQWRRRLEAWKYGSGNDYVDRKKVRPFSQ